MKEKLRLLFLGVLMVAGVGVFSQVSVRPGAEYKYLKGSDATALPANWKTSGFDDSAWSTGNSPFRFGIGIGGVELDDMISDYTTVFLRRKVLVSSLGSVGSVVIGTNCDDGYALWINGELISSKNAPDAIINQALVSDMSQVYATRRSSAGKFLEDIYSGSELPLVEGENVIAVCALNQALNSSDFYFDLKISSISNLPATVDSVGITFSNDSGFYENSFPLILSHPDPTYKVAYTVDGSNPMYSNTVAIGELGQGIAVAIDPASTYGGVRGITPAVVIRASAVQDGFKPSIPESRTYIFTEKVKVQDNPGYPWPDDDQDNWPNGQSINYNMTADVIEDPLYKDSIDIALKDIPTLSLVTDNDSLFGTSGGIYVNAENSGREWERNGSLELINPDQSEGFSVNAGVRIRGRASRGDGVPKHSFRLFFRSEYGNGKLKYPMFGEEGVDKFDKIDLRTAQNYAWHFNNPERNTFVREVFARDAQKDVGQPYTRSRYYHLYLNGMYWGIYQTQERAEANFSADYLGGTSDDYDVIKMSNEGSTSAEEHMITATDGTLEKWKEVYDRTLVGFSTNKEYFALEGKNENGEVDVNGEVFVDIDNLIDYMMNIFYTGNFDSPITKWSGAEGANKWINNMYAATNREDRLHGFKFYIHDAEHSLFVDPPDASLRYIPGIGLHENRVYIGDDTIPLERRMTVDQFEYFHPQWLHHKLCDNAEYRQRFADRAMNQLTDNGVWTPEKNRERFDNRAMQIEKAIIAESARWGDYNVSWWSEFNTYTKYNAWIPELNSIREGYFPYRTDILIDQLTASGLYSTLEAPVFMSGSLVLPEINTLTANVNVKVDNPNANGTIYYTTDGTDPRGVGGVVASGVSSVVSGGSIAITNSVHIHARVFYENKWSGIKKISFIRDQFDYSALKVTEVHYHPLDGYEGLDTISDSKYEFIEFKNTGSEVINLTGLVIDSAIYYEFPDYALLGAGEYFVVAAKPSFFFDRYGVLPSGNYSNKLSNSGERVMVLKEGIGAIIDFTYDDMMPWPTLPDGGGYSLESVEDNPTGFPASLTYWTSSDEIHGNPFGVTALPDNVAEVSVEDSYMIYPNPTDDMIYVRSIQESGKHATVSVYDLNGRLCYMNVVDDQGSISFSEEGLNYGMYIVKIESEGKSETKKVIYNP